MKIYQGQALRSLPLVAIKGNKKISDHFAIGLNK